MSPYRFILTFVIAVAGARAAALPIACRSCAASTEVILMIGLPSQDYSVRTLTRLWMEKHALAAQRRHRELTGETLRVVTRYPANLAEFRREVQQMADHCTRIKFLGIMSHGNTGYFQVGADGVGMRNIDDAFGRGLGCAMSPDASIEIAGCNVGRGFRGACLMLAAASRLLPGGGRIVAPESYVYGNALLGITPQSIFGDRELQVSAGAVRPRWTKGSVPGSACPADISFR